MRDLPVHSKHYRSLTALLDKKAVKPAYGTQLYNDLNNMRRVYPGFDKRIRAVHPDWFGNRRRATITEFNNRIVEWLSPNAQKPTGPLLSIWRCTMDRYPSIRDRIKVVHPDWFISQQMVEYSRKQAIMNLYLHPRAKKPVGLRLKKLHNFMHHNLNYKARIMKVHPRWFVMNPATFWYDQFLDPNAIEPMRGSPESKRLKRYCREHPEYTKKLQKVHPDWLIRSSKRIKLVS